MNEELLKLLMQMVGATNNPAMNTLSTKLKDYFKNQQGSKAFALNADPLTMIDPYKVNPAWSYQKGGETKETIWRKFLKGVSSLSPGVSGVGNMLANYGSLNPLNPGMDILAPMSIPGNMVQAAYTPGVSVGDAMKGQDVEKGFIEEILTDPLTYFGAATVPKALLQAVKGRSRNTSDALIKYFKTKDGAEYIKRWYSDPIIRNRISQYNADKLNPYSFNHIDPRLEEPVRNYIDLLKEDPLEYLRAGLTTQGTSGSRGTYINRPLTPTKSTRQSIIVHELNHAVNAGYNGYDQNALLKPFGYSATKSPDKSLLDYLGSAGRQYFTDPAEIHSRMMQARHAVGLEPREPFTEMTYNAIMQNNNFEGMGKYIKDKDSFIKLMNSYYKQGGAVNTTGYTPGYPSMNNPFNIIPGGNITMKDTPFNVLGIPMYGNKLGIPQLMNPGQNYNFPGAKGILEIPQMQIGGVSGIGFSNLAKKLFGNNNTKEPEVSKEYEQWINSDPRILKSEINTKVIGDLINQKSAIRSEDFYTDKDETIPLSEGYLRGAKLPVKLVKKAKKVGDKYGVDPLDILAIGAKESTFGYSPFAEERWGSSKDHRAKTMDFENGMSEQGIFTFNDIIFGMKPIPYPEFLYRKGDKRINPIKTFHGYEYDFDDDTALDIYSDDKNVKEYIKYLEKYQPKKVDIMEEVAKRIKEKGIAAYNPGQKNYAEMVEKYKQLLMNNKTPIKFQQGGYASFLMPSSHLTPEFSQQGFNYYFNDPLMVPEAKGGGFFGKLWGGIKKGLGAVGDQTLSFLGMPDVIKNSAYDTGAPNWLKKANSFIGNAATGIASAAIPGAGIAFNGLRGLVNNIGGGSNPGAGNIGGGGLGFLSGLNFNEPAYNSGSMLTGLNPFANMGGGNMGMFGNTGSFGTALGRLNVSLNGPGPFGGIGGGLFGGTPTFTGSPMQPRMYQEGGVVQEEAPQMIPIQTEKDEYLIHLDNAITPVNATKLHKKMDDDEVTDIVPEGTYVASNDKKIYMTKKQAEEIVMGLKSKSYEEFKKGMIPEKILFSEIFGKDKKLTPAELAERILKKFPTIDKNTTFNKSDIFTEITNEENMMARTPWLQQLVAFNESKRMGTPEGSFKKGGPVLKMKDVVSIPSTGGRVQKFGPGGNTDWGSIIGTAASALPFIADLFGANKGSEIDPMARNLIYGSAPLHALGLSQNINAQRNAFGQAIQDYTGLGQNLNQFAMGTAGANIAGRMMQDTNFQRFDPLAQQTRLANFNTRTPQSFVDALSTPRYDLNSLAATLGPRGFNTFAGQLAGQQMDTRNRAMMEQFNQDRNLGFNILGQQNALDSFSQQFNIGQAEKEMAAKNAQTAGVFGDIGSLFNRFGDIQSNILPATTQFNLQRANLSGQLPLGIAQNMLNMGSIMATTANGQQQQQEKPQSGSGANYPFIRSVIGQTMSNQNRADFMNPKLNPFLAQPALSVLPEIRPRNPYYDQIGGMNILMNN